jgi:predicted nucleotidyltransferase
MIATYGVELTPAQREIVGRVVALLVDVPGVAAVVLGGSHARGRARPDSDIDLGLYYRDTAPLEIDAIRTLAAQLNDAPDPVVSGIGEWGRWVDGGAWLTIHGQRVDLLYRSLDKVEHTLADAQAGRFELDVQQQPPYGFFGPTILGEAAIAVPLHDPAGMVAELKRSVAPMPAALIATVVQQFLWSTDFGLRAFAPKFAASGDAYGMAGCLSRFAHALVMVLFALNGRYPLNDKTSLTEISEFALAPADFSVRVQTVLGNIGNGPLALEKSMKDFADLFAETSDLAGNLYKPAWRF